MVLPRLIPQGYLWPVTGGVRVNPNAGVIRGLFYDGHSDYDSLQTQLSKLMKHGFAAQVAYTFSRNIDTGTSGVAGDTFGNSIPGLLWFDTHRTGASRSQCHPQPSCELHMDASFS